MPRSAPSARSARSLAAIALAIALSAGCDDDAMGEAGRLGFAFSTAEGRVAASTPVAVGARASLVLEDGPGLAFGAITSAASLDPDTLAVVQTEASFVVVEALAPGQTAVEVTALVGEDGAQVEDTIVIETREAEGVSFARACATEDGGPLLTRSPVALPFGMTDDDGAPLTGWGFYPIDVSPPGALVIDPQARATQRLPLRTTDHRGPIELSSALGGQPLTFEVVSEDEIEGAFLDGGERANDVALGGSREVRVVPIVRQQPICQGEPARDVEVLTPEVCSVGPGGPRDAIDASSALRVEGLARGTCRVTVHYPGAAGGQGVDATFALDVL